MPKNKHFLEVNQVTLPESGLC